MEIVSPKKPAYTKPLVVSVNHWAGSVGEGIAIGFDALKRATIIGTPMAGLNGAIFLRKCHTRASAFLFRRKNFFM